MVFFVTFLLAGMTGCSAAAPLLKPVYIHMNGANMFLENVVAVRPGEPVVFVNEDTGIHMVLGYNPLTGKANPRFSETLLGTPGPSHPVHTYTVRFTHPGIYYYYCPVHAMLKQAPGNIYAPVKRPTVHGFGTPMAGVIIVTKESALVHDNPPTSLHKVLPGYFTG
ncbi:Cupredoxin [mine drainage metagenome]|uniref:Cupredoxin n=2 Tax=mine drainage metagenome TaxID=410659 RepID=T1B5A5_9ZZZZ